MPLLYYWRGENYRRDLDHGVGYHLNQANPVLHDIDAGDSLWAFTRARAGHYALAAELVVSAKTRNPSGYRYGSYRIWGDLTRSRYFSVDVQPDITPLIRSTAVRAGGRMLGNAFQGNSAVRRFTAGDHGLLSAYATGLSREPRARLVPEERLEAILVSGDPEAVERLLTAEGSGMAPDRRRQLGDGARRRSRDLVLELREIYQGACQICDWQPRPIYGHDLCEAHHVRWISRGGEDSLSNLALLCPNHHRAVHRCDAPFDFGQKAFLFAGRREALKHERHVLEAC